MNNERSIKSVKVIRVGKENIEFDGGVVMFSNHEQDCCEQHYLSFNDLSLSDFEGLKFDLSGESFFERIPEYGIALKPINGLPVRIPGYFTNNGYYSSNLSLILSNGSDFLKTFDISQCQDMEV